MAVLKFKALEMLSTLIQERVPELYGRVCIAPSGREHLLEFPHLYIQATKWRLTTWDPDDVDPLTGDIREPEGGTVVFRVGDWTADIEIRLGCTSAQERYEIGDKVERMFFDGTNSTTALAQTNPYRPGIILVDVPQCYDARCAFLLGDTTWEDEKVFTQELYASLNIQAEIPILIERYSLNTISDLRLSLTHSLETLDSGDPLPSDAETIRINADGTVTKL